MPKNSSSYCNITVPSFQSRSIDCSKCFCYDNDPNSPCCQCDCPCGPCRPEGEQFTFCLPCGCTCGFVYGEEPIVIGCKICDCPKGCDTCYDTAFKKFHCCVGCVLQCFPSTARVSLENGESVSMSELQKGDRVQTGNHISLPYGLFTRNEI